MKAEGSERIAVGGKSGFKCIVNCLSGLQLTDDTTKRTTFEQAIGNALKINPLILGACSHLPYGIDTNGKLFWNGSYIDPQKNPAKVADALFGGASVVNADVQLRQDLLKMTASEIQTLQSSTSTFVKLAGTMLQSIWTDLPPADNTVTLDLSAR